MGPVWGVLQRSVERGQSRKEAKIIARYGVDEKAFKRGHNYMTVVCDLDSGMVEHVAEDRTTASLEDFWKSLTPDQREGVRCVTMDMWQAYKTATERQIPEAGKKIVFDRFHIMQYVVKAVDKVRRAEHKSLLAAGDDTLKGTRQLWLYSLENLSRSRQMLLNSLRALNLKVGHAWALKESLRGLWHYLCPTWARRFFDTWFSWVIESGMPEMVKVAEMLKRHLDNILTYAIHRVTNATAEGINSKIMAVKRRAGGYRNKEHFKSAIFSSVAV